MVKRVLGGFGLLAGATYPLRALHLLARQPHLWQYVLVPVFVNAAIAIALYGSIFYFGWPWLSDLTQSLDAWFESAIANLPQWLGFLAIIGTILAGFLKVGFAIALFLVIGILFVQFGTLLGSPWYGQLSEQLEKMRTGNVQVIDIGIIGDLWRATVFEVQKLVLALVVGSLLFAIGFVPGAAPFTTPIGSIALPTMLVCLDFFDAPLERRRLPFRKKLAIVLRNLPASASFGLTCWVLVSIPVVNFATIPFCVAGGTLFACDRILPKMNPKPSAIANSD